MANTHKGRRFFISNAPAGEDDLNQAAFEAMTWIEVGHVGNIGDIGTQENVVSYDEYNTNTTQKGKGIADAGNPTVEVARDYNDAGQVAMRAAALTRFNYGFKIIEADAPSASFTNTITYTRGLVAGVVRPGGRNEDFDLEVYTLGLNQRQVDVLPAALSVPVNVTRPAVIAGAAGTTAAGQVLTAYEGTWTNDPTSYQYQWQEDTANNGTYIDIAGATSRTYTIGSTGSQVGDSMRVRVKGVNGAGASAFADSLGTDLGV